MGETVERFGKAGGLKQGPNQAEDGPGVCVAPACRTVSCCAAPQTPPTQPPHDGSQHTDTTFYHPPTHLLHVVAYPEVVDPRQQPLPAQLLHRRQPRRICLFSRHQLEHGQHDSQELTSS